MNAPRFGFNPFKLFVPHFFTMANAGLIALAWGIGYFLDYINGEHPALVGTAFLLATAYMGAVWGLGPVLVKLNILYRTGWGFTKVDANLAVVFLAPFYVFWRLLATVDLTTITSMVVEGLLVGFLSMLLSTINSLITASIERAVANAAGS